MKTSVGFWKLTALVVVLLVLGNGFSAAADDAAFPIPVEPIPWDPDARPVPSFIGHEATPNPVTAMPIPQNPFLSPNPFNTIHKDTYQSDTYPNPGPLGHNPIVTTNYLGKNMEGNFGEPMPIYMFTDGLLATWISHMVGGINSVQLQLIDPDDLSVLATYDLPGEPSRGLMSLPAGPYMYLTNEDLVVIGTPDRTVWMFSHTCTGPQTCSFTPIFRDPNPPDADPHQKGTYDLRGAIPTEGDAIMALHPDFSGHLWFSSFLGVVGAVDMATGTVLGSLNLYPETTYNGFASDETGGVFFNTDRAMYRFDLDHDGKPVVTWREAYDYGTHAKTTTFGSGTTPTLMGTDLVNMVDNADPQMHVDVYRRAKDVEGDRLSAPCRFSCRVKAPVKTA